MKVIIKFTNGGIGVMGVNPNSKLTVSGNIVKFKLGNPGLYESHREMPNNAIPKDRYFREAWTDTTPERVVDIDMTKAKVIHMDKIRAKRNAKLKDLDLEYMQADEDNNGQLKAQLAQEKKRLRDIPETFDLSKAETPEELKALLPVI